MKTRFLIITLIGLSLISGACRKKTRVPPPPDYFQQAEAYFQSGDYPQAAQAYKTYLDHNPSAVHHDRALFRLGLIYSFPDSSLHNLQLAQETFQRLIEEFPESPLSPQAKLMLALYADLENLRADVREKDRRLRRLTNELEQLKKIDLERRPPKRPEYP